MIFNCSRTLILRKEKYKFYFNKCFLVYFFYTNLKFNATCINMIKKIAERNDREVIFYKQTIWH